MSKLIVFLFTFFTLTNCTQNWKQEKLITVRGEIAIEEIGVSLIHEHILVDWIGADSTGYHRWDRSEVIERALPFLLEAKEKGVKTFFECTPVYLGRDPLLLKELSEKTDINIVTNTGYYGAVNNKFIPEHAFNDTPEEIARIWIDEFNNGIDGTDIFPGFIKIGVERNEILSPIHTKIIKAAAIAHKATGLTIVSHTGNDGPAFAQLEILKDEGIAPEAFVWTHAQNGTFNGYIKAAKQGCWISIDNVNNNKTAGPGSIDWYVEILTKLKKEKLLHKILISHDSGWYNVGQDNGGNYRDYTDIFEYLLPALKGNGFSQEEIDMLLIKNPQRAYAVKIKKIKQH